MTTHTVPAKLEHETSSGLQVIDVHNGHNVAKIILDTETLTALPLSDVKWREIEMYVLAEVHLKEQHAGILTDSIPS